MAFQRYNNLGVLERSFLGKKSLGFWGRSLPLQAPPGSILTEGFLMPILSVLKGRKVGNRCRDETGQK